MLPVTQNEANAAAAALQEIAGRLELRGNAELAQKMRKVANGLTSGGVVVADGSS